MGAQTWCVRKLRVYLYGIPFIVHIDHQPVVHYMNMSEKKPRVHRMCDSLSSYQFEIRHEKGRDN